MKISLKWLQDYVDISNELTPSELSRLFTLHTAEVEGFEDLAASLEKVVMGQIVTIHPHPNADKLRVTTVDVGSAHKGHAHIVCGASNIFEGQYVAVALPGSKVRWHGEGELVELKPAVLRGVESFGMICAADEIGLGDMGQTSDGILDLSALKQAPGTPLAKVLERDDIIFTVDNKSLTHRPDLWGHYGIAREIAAITDQKLKALTPQVVIPTEGSAPQVEIKAKKLCSRYMAIRLENVTIEPSPIWLQTRLKAVGHRPINNVVDITNYVMLELGQPLHAFDAERIEGGIVVRESYKDEKITTLDGVSRDLPEHTLVIADHAKVIAIAGVMGGSNSEISSSTTSLLLEAATFHPSSVRKTSVKLGLRTEAVQRFEKSLDQHLAQKALERACELILKICPAAKISGPIQDVKNWKDKIITVNLDLKRLFSKIGKELPFEEIKKILTHLEFGVVQKSSRALKITVPSFRATRDITMEDDLIEEIARLHGYENIEPRLPELPIKLPFENRERSLEHKAREILSRGLGFDEVYNYSFYSKKDIEKTLLLEELHVKILNYLSEDQTHLRVSLVPNILKNIVHNMKYLDQCKFYEIGRTYQDLQEYFPLEEKKICGVIVRAGKKGVEPSLSYPSAVFYEAKGTLESFLKQMGDFRFMMDKGQSFAPYAHPNRYGEYFVSQFCFGEEKPSEVAKNLPPLDDSQSFARVFELHPLVSKNYGLENFDIAIFEINFTRLVQMPFQEVKYRSLPRFPGIEIDISVVLDERFEIGGVQKIIMQADAELIQKVTLFDVYKGANLPAGKKALAFKVLLQTPDRTLTDEEMKKVQTNIFQKLQAVGGEIRGL